MSGKTPKAAPTATLSQSELFQRFLEAKLRVKSMSSTLIKEPELPAATAEEWFLDWHGTESCCFDDDFAERVLDELRVSDEPDYQLERLVDDLANLLDGARMMHREFRALCDQARTEPPEDDAPIEAFRDWDSNPRYVLPVIEQKEAA